MDGWGLCDSDWKDVPSIYLWFAFFLKVMTKDN